MKYMNYKVKITNVVVILLQWIITLMYTLRYLTQKVLGEEATIRFIWKLWLSKTVTLTFPLNQNIAPSGIISMQYFTLGVLSEVFLH